MRFATYVEVWRRGIGRGVFPHQLSWILALPWRRLVLSPEALASRLPLYPGSSVLELGPGSGYYSAEVARHVPAGRLAVCDLQPEMLARCVVRCASAGLTNVGATAADGAALPFADARFDLIYMVTVFGEIRDKDACLREIRRVLRPGGVLSVSEHLPDPDFTSLASLQRRVERHGFVAERRYGPPVAYTANFRARR